MKKIYIVGAGGFGREVAWLIERINLVTPQWSLQGFLDDDVLKHGTKEGKYTVLGGCDYLDQETEDAWVVCAIGRACVREKVVEKISCYKHIKFATLIDPSVLFSDSVVIGEGSIICAGTILTVDIRVGKYVIINLDCTVGHDTVIADYVTICPSVNVSGYATVEQGAELGTGVQVIQGRRIGKGTILGAGAVVVRDLPEKCTAVGVPAKPVKFRSEE